MKKSNYPCSKHTLVNEYLYNFQVNQFVTILVSSCAYSSISASGACATLVL